MKEKVKDYELHQLAIQNDTDVRTERAIQQGDTQPQLTPSRPSGASSSGERRDVDLHQAANIARVAGKAGL